MALRELVAEVDGAGCFVRQGVRTVRLLFEVMIVRETFQFVIHPGSQFGTSATN